jgi:exosortase H (IPTLxxWG-CTERM-specific)
MKTAKRAVTLLKNPILVRAALLVGLLAGFSLALSPLSAKEHFSDPFTAGICRQAVWIINLFGINASQRDTAISGVAFSVDVKAGCNAIYEICLFVSAVIVYPSTLRQRFLGILYGVVIIYGFNLLRVVALFLIGAYDRNLFNMVHSHVSQALFIFLVVVLWLFWQTTARERTHQE